MVVDAVVRKPVRIASRLGVFGELLHAASPRLAQIIMNTAFRMFQDTPPPSREERKARNRPAPTRSRSRSCCAEFTSDPGSCLA